MKKDIAEIVSKCLTCQQVKLEHQRPSNFLQRLPTPKWKWDTIAMDLVSGLPRTLSGYDANIEWHRMKHYMEEDVGHLYVEEVYI